MSSSPEVAHTSANDTGAMTTADMERLVRAVIVERGFGCTLLSVTASPPGWNVMVRASTGHVIRFTVSTHRAIAARVAVQEALDVTDTDIKPRVGLESRYLQRQLLR